MADITICRARGRRLAKLIRPGAIVAYDNARLFDLHSRPVADLADLHRLLLILADRPDCAVVRGAIADPGRVRAVRRLLHADPATGDPPSLAEVPRQWLAIDCDNVPLAEGTDPRDLGDCARQAIALLPADFHDAGAIVAATAGHGFKPGARLRLWYWLARPLTGAECKRWMAAAPVDPSIFGAATLIYTASPIFADGAADPLPHRMVTLPGRPVVTPPSAAALAPPPPRPTPTAWYSTRGGEVRRLAALIRHVATTPEGERHRALYWAACRVGEMAAAGNVSPTSAADALVQAAMAAGGQDQRKAEATAHDGIARGMNGGARHV